ncbi:hypothetical protein SKAU_G00390810 [Synaphobranchus kaupii]|uniref:Uncharacterized protein n=1 Tax=Synaphobranchus kaupii TaxID=118154 RepID=A0A9Q1EBI1_SYNKA|nr:hypothetical protein SKAU_G00390810 [Synaphobranchus kaupii]
MPTVFFAVCSAYNNNELNSSGLLLLHDRTRGSRSPRTPGLKNADGGNAPRHREASSVGCVRRGAEAAMRSASLCRAGRPRRSPGERARPTRIYFKGLCVCAVGAVRRPRLRSRPRLN